MMSTWSSTSVPLGLVMWKDSGPTATADIISSVSHRLGNVDIWKDGFPGVVCKSSYPRKQVVGAMWLCSRS